MYSACSIGHNDLFVRTLSVELIWVLPIGISESMACLLKRTWQWVPQCYFILLYTGAFRVPERQCFIGCSWCAHPTISAFGIFMEL